MVFPSIGQAKAAEGCCGSAADGTYPVAVPTYAPPAYRQCRGLFFSQEFSAWFSVDCLVPGEQAQPGLFVMAIVPSVGEKRLWLAEVYDQPKLNPPPDFRKAVAARQEPAAARIVLTLPNGASLNVNGRRVSATAGKQEVIVKNLAPHAVYEYRLTATFQRDGRPVNEERQIAFRAGDRIALDFTLPPGMAAARN
jgi:uncharacterized protein (TIGR03000 family)